MYRERGWGWGWLVTEEEGPQVSEVVVVVVLRDGRHDEHEHHEERFGEFVLPTRHRSRAARDGKRRGRPGSSWAAAMGRGSATSKLAAVVEDERICRRCCRRGGDPAAASWERSGSCGGKKGIQLRPCRGGASHTCYHHRHEVEQEIDDEVHPTTKTLESGSDVGDHMIRGKSNRCGG